MHHKKLLDFQLLRYKAREQGCQPGALAPLATRAILDLGRKTEILRYLKDKWPLLIPVA